MKPTCPDVLRAMEKGVAPLNHRKWLEYRDGRLLLVRLGPDGSPETEDVSGLIAECGG